MGPRSRRYLLGLGGAVALGAILRAAVHRELAAADPTFDRALLDGRILLDWAARIAGGDWAGEGAFHMNPLFPYLAAPVVAVAGERALGAIRLVHAAVGLASVLLVAGAARRLLGRREALVAAFLAAAWPATILLEFQPLGETFLLFFHALGLFLLARFRARPGPGRLLAAGTALGFAVLGRPTAILLPAVLPIWLRRLDPRGGIRRLAGTTAILFAGVLLPILPLAIRNLAVLGEPVLATTSLGATLHQGNNPFAWETGRNDSREIVCSPFLVEASSRAVAEPRAGRALTAAEASRWWTRHVLDECAREPGRAAGFLARKALGACASPEIPSDESFLLAREESAVLRLLAVPLAFGLAFPFAALGAAGVVRRRRRALPLVLAVAVHAAALVLFFPLSRYRLVLMPAFLPLAAAGAVSLLRPSPRHRPGPGSLAVLLGAALLSHGALLAGAAGLRSLGPYPDSTSSFRALRAHVLLDESRDRAAAGDPEGAARALDLADDQARRARGAASPGDGTSWLVEAALARVAEGRSRYEEEDGHLAAALAEKPDHPGLLAARALNLLRRGRREEAVAAGRAAREAGATLAPEVREAVEGGK